MMLTRKSTLLLSTIFLLLFHNLALANLLTNPGFESGDTSPSNWRLTAPSPENSIEWKLDHARTGEKGIKLIANVPEVVNTANKVAIHSDLIPITDQDTVEFSAWVKAKNINRCGEPDVLECLNWYQFRITIAGQDSTGAKTGHRDVISADGDICFGVDTANCDWRYIKMLIPVFKNSVNLQIAISLTTSTGEAIVDDIDLHVIEKLPTFDITQITQPVIIPTPQHIILGNDKFPLVSLAITIPQSTIAEAGSNYLISEINEYFTNESINFEINPTSPNSFDTQLILTDTKDPQSITQFQQHFPTYSLEELGKEGYFINTTHNNDIQNILTGANSTHGLFHAFQTIKQLVNNGEIYIADIIDFPQNSTRGMVLSRQWIKESPAATTAINRLAELKGNFIWSQGNLVNGKLTHNWRIDFTPAELDELNNVRINAESHFMEMYLSFSPRTLYSNRICMLSEYPSVIYSETQTVSILVAKISQLYDIGFRNFGFSFDDMDRCGEDKLLATQDLATFDNSIGKAHVFIVNSVYNAITDLYSDVNFKVVPLWYSATINNNIKKDRYLQELSFLDENIGIVAVPLFNEDIQIMTTSTNRPVLIWSNAYSKSTNQALIPPYQPAYQWNDHDNLGFIFLPSVPNTVTEITEDEALVSWKSSLSYAWSPMQYRPELNYAKIAVEYLGVASNTQPNVSNPIISNQLNTERDQTIVNIVTTTPNTNIYYTLDNSEPNDNSQYSIQYQIPFPLTQTKIVKARAYRDNYVESDTVTIEIQVNSETDKKPIGSSPSSGTLNLFFIFFITLLVGLYRNKLSPIYK